MVSVTYELSKGFSGEMRTRSPPVGGLLRASFPRHVQIFSEQPMKSRAEALGPSTD